MSLSPRFTDLRRVLPESQFLDALCLERKRAERSRQPFVLMLLDFATPPQAGGDKNPLERTAPTILASVRETDIVGWNKQRSALGIIFAELGMADKEVVLSALRTKVMNGLGSVLPTAEIEHVNITFCCFPEDWSADELPQLANVAER